MHILKKDKFNDYIKDRGETWGLTMWVTKDRNCYKICKISCE